MAAILLDRHLQSVANYLILSLAVADLLVAILVMPLGAVYEVIFWISIRSLNSLITDQQKMDSRTESVWHVDFEWCSLLHSVYLTFTSYSIGQVQTFSSLCFFNAISNRYWAVTHPHYIHSRSSSTIWILISLVWVVSIVVSLAPLFGWKDQNWSERVEDGACMVSGITCCLFFFIDYCILG